MADGISRMAHLSPGTRIKVGQYSTKVVRYLSEGGFSHVYIAKLDIPIKGSDIAVLKRIIAPDKLALSAIRTEVETMKKLRGHRHIVTYFDSHATELKGGGFEVYVLMEFCAAGGLIDFMNTRLQTRLAEWEVLKIFSDTAEAVACMHYLRPPLLHRDLKIENVLISSTECYKLCDFGSCSEVRPAATNTQERRVLEDDIQKNTTVQYRSPEMVDTTRRQPIDEKSDIWALGVLLYKLCYFTTPFEAQGQMAILNAAYTFPPFPPYTDRTKRLIAVMLQENPKDRPNIYQLIAEVCAMRNTKVPIQDIYSRSAKPAAQIRPRPPSVARDAKEPVLLHEPEKKSMNIATPEVEPMRRGRPVRQSPPPDSTALQLVQTKQAASTSLANGRIQIPAFQDDFTSKFPSLDDLDASLDITRQQAAQQGRKSEEQMPTVTRALPKVPLAKLPNKSEKFTLDGAGKQTPQSASKFETSRQFHDEDPILRLAGSGLRNVTQTAIGSRQTQPNVSQASYESAPASSKQHSEAGFRPRPQLVNRSSQTSPKQRGQQTQTSPPKSQPMVVDSTDKPRIAMKPHEWHSSIDRDTSSALRDAQGFIAPAPMRPRPLTVHMPVNKDSNEPSTGLRPPSRPASATESRTSDSHSNEILEGANARVRRSASSGHGKHTKRPSLTQIGSFSGAAKTLVNGKFGDAFRKFESSGSKSKTQASQFSEPLFVEEVDDLPDHIANHLRNTSARRSLSYGRTQSTTAMQQVASQAQEETNVDQSSYSVKEAMRRLREKAAQPYEAKSKITGYGRYTDSAPTRSATVIPTTRTTGKLNQQHSAQQLPSKSSIRSSVSGEDEDFEKRYPSLPFTV